jgi:hypothetical protein
VTTAARKVLFDCRVALGMLEEEIDTRRWRVTWVGAMALIRVVGHVLDKVDGRANEKLGRLANARFARWKMGSGDDRLFLQFIDQERNSILKQYSFGVDTSEVVQIEVVSLAQERFPRLEGTFDLDENLFRPVSWDGAVEDARDLYGQAINWWQRQLDELDRELDIGCGP